MQSPESANLNNEVLQIKFECFTYSMKTTLVTTDHQIIRHIINNLNINSVDVSEYSLSVHQKLSFGSEEET